MNCIANYEIESNVSVISDETQLKIQHPKENFKVFIKNLPRTDYSTPFLLSLQIIFEAPSLREAENVADDKLAECLNMLAFVTAASFKKHRIRLIVDDNPPKQTMRECLILADPVRYQDPQPFLDEKIVSSIERLMQFNLPPAVSRALRWYRIGVQPQPQEDQFQCFWFALEILAEYKKTPTPITDQCPKCKSSLYCETCKTYPTHRPYPKQAIRALIQTVEKNCDEKTIDALDETRNGLMHGATLKEIKNKLPTFDEDIVDVLGRILFKVLLYQFSNELLTEENLVFGYPSTYAHRKLTAFVHAKTVVPLGPDDEIDLHKFFTGLKVSMELGRPPQSGKPRIIIMTPEQHKQLGLLTHEKSDYQELCQRLYKKVEMHDGKVMALVLSTDMAQISKMLNHSEVGKVQDLFRDIMGTNHTSVSK